MSAKCWMQRFMAGCLVVLTALPVSTMAQINRSLPVVALDPLDGKQTLIYDELIFGGPSITRRLWATQSTDDGMTWSPSTQVPLGPNGIRQPAIVTSFQSGPSLLRAPLGGYLLFHHYGGVAPSDIWRHTSANGIDWQPSTLVDLGWPNAGGAGAGSGFPSVLRDGDTSLAMLYERFVGDGADAPGLYLSRSFDLGVTWSPQRTLVAADVAFGTRAMLTQRASDGRYLATYIVSPTDGDNRVVVKASDNVLSWTAPAVLEIPGNNQAPALVTMPDGTFLLLYATVIGDQTELFSRRSQDGITWDAEIQQTNSPGMFDTTPFGVSGTSSDQIEVYWSRTSDLSGFGAQIVHETFPVVRPDLVFASGFGE